LKPETKIEDLEAELLRRIDELEAEVARLRLFLQDAMLAEREKECEE